MNSFNGQMTNYKYTLVFIFNDKDVLLLERSNDPIKGQRTGVGGHIELNEKPLQCAYRELYEETGISTSDLINNKLYPLGALKDINSVIFFGVINQKPFNIKIFDEGKLEWFNIDTLNEIPNLTKESKMLIKLALKI